jgi:hypothetical protein
MYTLIEMNQFSKPVFGTKWIKFAQKSNKNNSRTLFYLNLRLIKK